MNNKFKTAQEEFWAGPFGIDYIDRNCSDTFLASNIYFFSRILKSCGKITSVLELGANIGMNIKALKHLLPEASFAGVEINADAYTQMVQIPEVRGYHQSLFDFKSESTFNLVLIKGVLIHLNPEMLSAAYRKLYENTDKYICIAEYYNPTPVTLNYRGHSDKLFKRDFAGELMTMYPDLQLLDYGFAYHKDPQFPQDDITWFLLKK